MSEPAPLKQITHRFLGGSLTLKPQTTFIGKTGLPVNLPDRATIKVEGKSLNLTYSSMEAVVELFQSPKARPFLEALQHAEDEGSQE